MNKHQLDREVIGDMPDVPIEISSAKLIAFERKAFVLGFDKALELVSARLDKHGLGYLRDYFANFGNEPESN